MITPEQVRKLLTLHGELRPQPPGDWTGPFPLPAEVERFYQDIGPFDIYIRGYGNPYFIPSLARLAIFQAGYRWVGYTDEPTPDWNDDWLVVADEGGDPFIFVQSSGVVLHAFHGEGEWTPREMFPDLITMAASLALIDKIVMEAGETLTDAECNLRPESLERASACLEDLLGSASSAKAILGRLWLE